MVKTSPEINHVRFSVEGAVILDFSMLNWMIYFHGHSKDFDEWESLGNQGWGWRDVKPFFKKAEKWTGPNPNFTYGTEGRFNLMPNPYLDRVNEVSHEMFEILFQTKYSNINIQRKFHSFHWYTSCQIVFVVIYALQALGIPIRNVNNEHNEDEGFFYRTPMALKNGARQGTYRSYVEPEKRNVDVMTYSLTSKVILDDTTKSAKGVQVERFGETLQYFASNEVILSAGAIGSPQGR